MTQIPVDEKFMRRALSLAWKGKGRTLPNPMVGCVIVKAGRVMAEGWHKFCGGDHAEIVALKQAGVKAKGATMYVTLEPCSHWGRTPPCVEAMRKAGIKKVVVATVDPNPVNNGKSLKILKRHGIKVVLGVLGQEARTMNAPFIKFITKKMPFVVAKSAQTLDGKIATRRGDSKWITSEKARAYARRKRDEFDAILVGINTVLADNPRLTAPTKILRKIVVDSRLRTPESAKLFAGSVPGQVILAVTRKAPAARFARLEKRGARIIVCPEKNGKVDLKWLFKDLAKVGIASILVEGGAAVIGSAFKERLVDSLHVYIAPRIIGDGKAQGAVTGLDIDKVSASLSFSIRYSRLIGKDLFIEADRV